MKTNNITIIGGLSQTNLIDEVDYAISERLKKNECSFDNLQKKFSYKNFSYNSFIIEDNSNEKMKSLYVLNKFNETDVLNYLSDNTSYVVSPFYNDSIFYKCKVDITAESIVCSMIYKQLYYISNNKLFISENKVINQDDKDCCVMKKQITLFSNKLQQNKKYGTYELYFIVTPSKVIFDSIEKVDK